MARLSILIPGIAVAALKLAAHAGGPSEFW